MRVQVPGDKSLTQRALILAALSEEESRLSGLLAGDDPQHTAAALRALGADVPAPDEGGGEIRVRGRGLRGLRQPESPLDFGNSGTGARLMMGVLAGQSFAAVLTGDASLRVRPMGRVTHPLESMGALFEWLSEDDRLPVRVVGASLHSMRHETPVASAQVKSALLLAGLVSGVPVQVSEPRRSRDHTERMFGALGVGVITHEQEGRWLVELTDPPQTVGGLDIHIPGDPSSAAFVLALGALGARPVGDVIEGVGLNPTRVGFLEVFRRMGVGFELPSLNTELPWEPVGDVVLSSVGTLRATTIGADEIPGLIDEIPIIAALAARAEGVTRITGAAELRVKETDRISALVQNLRAVGVRAEELDDGLEIEGTDAPLSGEVKAFRDHRIAMAFGVLGAIPGNNIEVDDPSVTDVSFPGFWELLRGDVSSRRTQHPAKEEERGPVVTLDGPAGSGKSSTAREVARRLGFRHLDSGALYRSLSYGLQRAGIPQDVWPNLGSDDLDQLGICVRPVGSKVEISLGVLRLDSELRTSEVTEVVSSVAKLPAVREWLLGVQRSLGKHGNLVADGRDMGSVVFPDADLKVFLVADLEERARRRLIQDGNSNPTPDAVTSEAIKIEDRDRIDSEREHSPLVRPRGAIDLDTTDLDFEAQVTAIVERVVGLKPQ